MTVVSDTSPIINLARINKLDILHHSFGGIVIPRPQRSRGRRIRVTGFIDDDHVRREPSYRAP